MGRKGFLEGWHLGQVLKVSGTLLNIREPRKRSTGWDNDGKNEEVPRLRQDQRRGEVAETGAGDSVEYHELWIPGEE